MTSLTDLREEAAKLLDALGEDQWFCDHDWRRDGADQVLDADDKTVCFIATGMSHDKHYARTRFIANAPRLIRALLAALGQSQQGWPQKDLPEEAARVLRENASEMYDDTPPSPPLDPKEGQK